MIMLVNKYLVAGVWAVSFGLTLVLSCWMNAAFWVSFAVFVGSSILLSNKKYLTE